jgi:hypothetical protein
MLMPSGMRSPITCAKLPMHAPIAQANNAPNACGPQMVSQWSIPCSIKIIYRQQSIE